jgi:hypothetical protein
MMQMNYGRGPRLYQAKQHVRIMNRPLMTLTMDA